MVRRTEPAAGRFAPRLAEHPGDARGDNPGYPIRWTGILGDIFQPLGLKYADRLIIDERIRPPLHRLPVAVQRGSRPHRGRPRPRR